MKTLALLLVLGLAGCTSSTRYGDCIGAFDEGDPNLRYSTSGWNVALGIIFIETIVVPAVVIANEARCPVGNK